MRHMSNMLLDIQIGSPTHSERYWLHEHINLKKNNWAVKSNKYRTTFDARKKLVKGFYWTAFNHRLPLRNNATLVSSRFMQSILLSQKLPNFIEPSSIKTEIDSIKRAQTLDARLSNSTSNNEFKFYPSGVSAKWAAPLKDNIRYFKECVPRDRVNEEPNLRPLNLWLRSFHPSFRSLQIVPSLSSSRMRETLTQWEPFFYGDFVLPMHGYTDITEARKQWGKDSRPWPTRLQLRFSSVFTAEVLSVLRYDIHYFNDTWGNVRDYNYVYRASRQSGPKPPLAPVQQIRDKFDKKMLPRLIKVYSKKRGSDIYEWSAIDLKRTLGANEKLIDRLATKYNLYAKRNLITLRYRRIMFAIFCNAAWDKFFLESAHGVRTAKCITRETEVYNLISRRGLSLHNITYIEYMKYKITTLDTITKEIYDHHGGRNVIRQAAATLHRHRLQQKLEVSKVAVTAMLEKFRRAELRVNKKIISGLVDNVWTFHHGKSNHESYPEVVKELAFWASFKLTKLSFRRYAYQTRLLHNMTKLRFENPLDRTKVKTEAESRNSRPLPLKNPRTISLLEKSLHKSVNSCGKNYTPHPYQIFQRHVDSLVEVAEITRKRKLEKDSMSSNVDYLLKHKYLTKDDITRLKEIHEDQNNTLKPSDFFEKNADHKSWLVKPLSKSKFRVNKPTTNLLPLYSSVTHLRKLPNYTSLKYSRTPARDSVSGGAAALLAALFGFLISEKAGFELVDSGDFYYLFMYLVFLGFSIKPLLRIATTQQRLFEILSPRPLIDHVLVSLRLVRMNLQATILSPLATRLTTSFKWSPYYYSKDLIIWLMEAPVFNGEEVEKKLEACKAEKEKRSESAKPKPKKKKTKKRRINWILNRVREFNLKLNKHNELKQEQKDTK